MSTATGRLFLAAGLYNAGILLFSRGCGDALGAVDPLFDGNGCVGVLLWGLAYAALHDAYHHAPKLCLVFALEKLFYGGHWLAWLSAHGGELPELLRADPLTGIFFALYGIGDLGFAAGFFAAFLAHRHPRAVSGEKTK
mmetsp:Transcript_14151/g.36311  ORF Transcript_14151/g.36311 Transcript_14151/m.36311 type:complete len:139 (+) Transcript_14151:105-521(+)|eukprot:jgi/Tetstr1/462350/TSEL_007356.t1